MPKDQLCGRWDWDDLRQQVRERRRSGAVMVVVLVLVLVAIRDEEWLPLPLLLQVMKYGARNSLLLAPMPTASTAQILGEW